MYQYPLLFSRFYSNPTVGTPNLTPTHLHFHPVLFRPSSVYPIRLAEIKSQFTRFHFNPAPFEPLPSNGIFFKKYFRILDDNQIHVLKQGMLDSLKNIEFLSIRRNKLERIPKFGPDHAKLKHLDLSENQLEKIDAFTFRFLNNLESLNLSKNHLKGTDFNFVKFWSKLRCPFLGSH